MEASFFLVGEVVEEGMAVQIGHHFLAELINNLLWPVSCKQFACCFRKKLESRFTPFNSLFCPLALSDVAIDDADREHLARRVPNGRNLRLAMDQPVAHGNRVFNSEGFARGEGSIHSPHPQMHEIGNMA